MQRKNLMIFAFCLSAIFVFGGCSTDAETKTTKGKEIYEWRVYTLSDDATQLDDFFAKVLIPAYNRQNISVGAFTLFEKGETELRYLLLVYPDITSYQKTKQSIWKDQAFRSAAQPFYDQTAPSPVYSNFESFLCEAFDRLPEMRKPDKERTVFELRLYHSPNEEANQRKVKMFNDGEIDIFDKVGINSVCYGEILAGSRMPALIYLTWYKDIPARTKAWDAFRADPDWARMKGLSEYAHTATNNKSWLLAPMPYSQF